MNPIEFYERWRNQKGITVEGYQLNYNQTIDLLEDYRDEFILSPTKYSTLIGRKCYHEKSPLLIYTIKDGSNDHVIIEDAIGKNHEFPTRYFERFFLLIAENHDYESEIKRIIVYENRSIKTSN